MPSALDQQRLLAAAVSKYKRLQRDEAFDAFIPESRATEDQQAVLDAIRDGNIGTLAVRGGNQSGKSSIGARVVTWFLQENFPNWTKPSNWVGPIQMLVLARTLKQAEESLWRKMEPFLQAGSYKVQRNGGVISKVTHIETQNTVLFLSHENANEARQRVQSFTSNFAWIDELPKSVKLIEEVAQRVRKYEGQLLLTFTPKSPAPDIARYVDGLEEPFGKQYTLLALDNPSYSEENKKRLLESLKSFSEAYQNTVLRGDWLQPDEMVYQFNHDTMVMAPPNYSPGWRHVEASDPAARGKHGLLVAAENPSTGKWYIIRDDYISGMLVPSNLVKAVQEKTNGVNIVRRVCDPHETWYIHQASHDGVKPPYMTPFNKSQRKGELIKNFQEALGSKIFIAPWCTNMIDELTSAHWSATGDKIVDSSKYHLCDAGQYLVDCLPKSEVKTSTLPWELELKINHRKKIEERAKRQQTPAKPYTPRKVRRRKRW